MLDTICYESCLWIKRIIVKIKRQSVDLLYVYRLLFIEYRVNFANVTAKKKQKEGFFFKSDLQKIWHIQWKCREKNIQSLSLSLSDEMILSAKISIKEIRRQCVTNDYSGSMPYFCMATLTASPKKMIKNLKTMDVSRMQQKNSKTKEHRKTIA